MTDSTTKACRDFVSEFVLISVDGDEISFPTYDLMSWSKGFRDLITTGQGDQKVQLEEKAVTIKQFKEIIDTLSFEPVDSKDFCFFDQVVALARFIDKYESSKARRVFDDYLTLKCQDSWPPLVLFNVGVALDQPRICEQALDALVHSWSHYCEPFRPKGLAGDDKLYYCLHPDGIPYHLLSVIPVHYLVALTMTGMAGELRFNRYRNEDSGKANMYGSEFMSLFGALEQRAKRSRELGLIG